MLNNTTQHNTTQHNTTQQNARQQNARQKSNLTKLFFVLICNLFLITACFDNESTSKQIEKNENLEIRNGGSFAPCAPDPEAICPNPPSTVYFNLTDVAGYPGCYFEVYVTIADCNGLFYMTDYSMVDYTCPQFDADLTAALAAGGSVLQNFFNTFDNKIYSAIELYLFSQGQYQCPSSQLSTNWSLAACAQRCIKYVTKNGRTYKVPIATRACGTGCCYRSTSICRDPATNQIIVSTTNTTTGQPSNCTGTADFTGLNCDAITVCLFRCQ